MADRMATMTERFEKLLQSRDLVRQELESASAGSMQRRTSQVDNSAQVQQLAQLNQNLQDIVKSFEKFQNETQKTVDEISLEGRRAEIAYEEIRSVQRQLESQIERARLRDVPQAAVLLAPATQVATRPHPGAPPFASPWPGGVATTVATPLAPPPTDVPPVPLDIVPPPSVPASPSSVAATTRVAPQCSAPAPRLLSPEMTGGVHLPGASVQEQQTTGRFPNARKIPPQTTIDRTPGSPDNQTELLLTYKARRLMQEAEEAMAAGESAIAASRALQARSLATAGGSQNEYPEHPRAKTLQNATTTNFLVPAPVPAPSPVPAVLASASEPGGAPDIEPKHQQAMQLMVQARAAIAAGDLQRATDLASQAEALKTSYGPSDDRPSLIRDDIAWLTEARLASSVVARTDSVSKSSPSTSGPGRLEAGKPVQLAELPGKTDLVPAVDHTNPGDRKLVKSVAYEHVYRFKLADVEPAAGTTKEPPLSGVPCRQCGKIHTAETVNQHKFITHSKPVQPVQPVQQTQQTQRTRQTPQTQRRKLIAPDGARRSNRRMLEDSDDSAETSAIWDAPAFSWATNDKAKNQPSTMHRLSSALRRLGRPATK
ncbi:MAG: hypothetical protein GY903_01695 [Fuerstiella sp.]|nr:hypothetical protein [Fuerstiella sp.]MCP4853191.1 hypothetical protein [Fuerstiella sp.]